MPSLFRSYLTRPFFTTANAIFLNVAVSHLIMMKVRGVNDAECRDLAKSYLACRMDRNLMAKDEFRNLGFDNGPKPANDPNGLALSQAQAQGSTGKDKDAKPGELRW
ncbi:CHCH domain-containing protein [Colletotrichum costaricense]|uniref:CHCH domain-containing protein n=1 Tax=Colletotrichum costaricense TaxID=1209916 RepID=A0AAI9YXK5_9PEZI|nr:CHCH domain-containing protein [Colletotrichum costaricense]KAK1527494.1 CHCH domain-containing protein [Colletotrichum costaricense]